jgi:hypothetical protein
LATKPSNRPYAWGRAAVKCSPFLPRAVPGRLGAFGHGSKWGTALDHPIVAWGPSASEPRPASRSVGDRLSCHAADARSHPQGRLRGTRGVPNARAHAQSAYGACGGAPVVIAALALGAWLRWGCAVMKAAMCALRRQGSRGRATAIPGSGTPSSPSRCSRSSPSARRSWRSEFALGTALPERRSQSRPRAAGLAGI